MILSVDSSVSICNSLSSSNFTRNQTKDFFIATIKCPDDQVIAALGHEGIDEVADLVDFVETDIIKMVVEIVRKPAGDVDDPNNKGTCIPIPRAHFEQNLSCV